MPSLYSRNGIYYIKITPAEKRLLGYGSRSTGTRIKAEADQRLKEVKYELLKADLTGSAVKKTSRTFSGIFERYKTDYKSEHGRELNSVTLRIYSQAVKYFFSACDDKLIKLYTRDDYFNFTEAMDKGKLAHNSKAIYSARIYTIFNYARKEGYINTNPMRIIREQIKELYVPPKEDVEKILDYARSTKFYFCLQFMKATAMRANEAVNCRWEDIGKNKIYVRKPKGGDKVPKHRRYIPLVKFSREIIAQIPGPREGKIFDFDYNALRYFFYRAEKATGIKFESHYFRRYCLSRMANSGIKLYSVRNYARHSDIKTTLRYYTDVELEEMQIEIDEKLEL